MTRKLIAYLLAVVVAYLLGAVLISQFNIFNVVSMGFSVSTEQRVSAALHDVFGMLSTYLPLISVAFLIAFLFTSFVLLRFVKCSGLLFVLAGFTAIVALHLVMGVVLGLTGLAPTRTLIGLLAQGCAGAVGGYVYYVLVKVDY